MKTRILEKQYADRYEFLPQYRFCFMWITMTENTSFGYYYNIVKETKAEAAAYIKNKHPDIIFHYPV
jgi:hypothetical protein